MKKKQKPMTKEELKKQARMRRAIAEPSKVSHSKPTRRRYWKDWAQHWEEICLAEGIECRGRY